MYNIIYYRVVSCGIVQHSSPLGAPGITFGSFLGDPDGPRAGPRESFGDRCPLHSHPTAKWTMSMTLIRRP